MALVAALTFIWRLILSKERLCSLTNSAETCDKEANLVLRHDSSRNNSELRSRSMRVIFQRVSVLIVALTFTSKTRAKDILGYVGCFKHVDGNNLYSNSQTHWIIDNGPLK